MCQSHADLYVAGSVQKLCTQTFPRNPWFDAECKAAKKVKNRVYYSDASDQEKQIAVQCFHAVTDRVKKVWLVKHAAELFEMASKNHSEL